MIEQIDNDLKQALKNQDKFTLSVLRMLKSEFINESRKGTLHELTDDEVVKVIKRQVKVRKDSISEYTNYGKMELVKDLEKEVAILSNYLPEEMSEEQIAKVIDEVFDELKPTSMKDMGNVMKTVSAKLTNADLAMVSKLIKDRLS
jgi:uncharacterized protein YqeY